MEGQPLNSSSPFFHSLYQNRNPAISFSLSSSPHCRRRRVPRRRPVLSPSSSPPATASGHDNGDAHSPIPDLLLLLLLLRFIFSDPDLFSVSGYYTVRSDIFSVFAGLNTPLNLSLLRFCFSPHFRFRPCVMSASGRVG